MFFLFFAAEEAFLRANSSRLGLRSGTYMTSDGTRNGIVRLVTTGKTVAAKEAEKIAEKIAAEEEAERRRQAAEEEAEAEKRRLAAFLNNIEMIFVQGNGTIDNFNIGKYEVTQGLWQAVMGNNPSGFKSGDNHPVETVSWNHVQEFLSKLNAITGKNYRLPTEAEWEYAARGGNRSQGFEYSGSNNVNDVAWYRENSGRRTHQVGTKRANELGIHDMSGNVSEWCQDSQGSERWRRGGSWIDYAEHCRVTSRSAEQTPNHLGHVIGFRLAHP